MYPTINNQIRALVEVMCMVRHAYLSSLKWKPLWCTHVLVVIERIMKEGKGRGKEREAPTHLIEHLKLTHAGRVTKNRTLRVDRVAN